MQDVYTYMRGGKLWPFIQREFRVLLRRPKWVNFSCPGNACGLDPEDYYEKSLDWGYQLVPHNVDSPLQQLTLLAGVAMLYQLARQEGF